MTEQKIELKMIRMSEVQSQEIEWLGGECRTLVVSIHSLWQADNYSG